MNRFIISFLALSAGAVLVNGAQLTPEEALERLMLEGGNVRKVSTKGNQHLAYTAATGDVKQFYIFNNNGGDGYTIVSADDRISPLIGYSDSGTFSPTDMPENMRKWLEGYQRQIDWAIAHDINLGVQAKTGQERRAIEPLLKTRWGQDSPYNNLCPTVSSIKAATGCVATAMAQIMNYHEWPKKGVGSHSYICQGRRLSVNFDETNYDWDNMLDSYAGSSTDAQKEAVATLMYSCGVSVDMAYGPSSGTASHMAAYALVTYFNYDKGTTYMLRDYFSGDVWEQMVYNDLADGLPVMYDGVTSGDAGHEFVCDGYRNGYFHFNWGWDGMSDGYFKLSLLDPGAQGTGGADSGFDFMQGATFGIRKPTGGSTMNPMMIALDGKLSTSKTNYKRNETMTISAKPYIYFCSGFSVSGRFGLKLTDAGGNDRYVYATGNSMTINGMSTGVTKFYVSCSSLPQSGTYTVKAAFYNNADEKWYDVLIPLGQSGEFSMTVDNDNISINPVAYDSQITVDDVNVLTPLCLDVDFHVTATAKVSGSEYYGQVYGALCTVGNTTIQSSAGRIQLDVVPGEPLEIDYVSQFTRSIPAGEYDFYFMDENAKPVSSPVRVNYLGSSGSTTIELADFAAASRTMPVNQLTFTGTIKCTSGMFASKIEVAILKGLGSGTPLTFLTSEPIWVAAGESCDFTVTGEYLDGNTGLTTYTAYVYANDGYFTDNGVTFRMSDATTSLDKVSEEVITIYPNPADNYITVNGNDIETIEIYSLTGVKALTATADGSALSVDITSLAPGHYIAVVTDADGVSTHKLIKR